MFFFFFSFLLFCMHLAALPSESLGIGVRAGRGSATMFAALIPSFISSILFYFYISSSSFLFCLAFSLGFAGHQ
ncbi:hypothetical protein TRSC58_07202 [Trypanosoma rangeli SC58]|uniref:Secreted peptide n=1 Tax=Trypanosoma rangeli SC58 TaxID=429131 RepID=A0A061ITQ1_TRYRA|nr:hypothetical protein TRSC58_07202 [Trypanosoma rangeli SC58]